jgi:hypothetical protein
VKAAATNFKTARFRSGINFNTTSYLGAVQKLFNHFYSKNLKDKGTVPTLTMSCVIELFQAAKDNSGFDGDLFDLLGTEIDQDFVGNLLLYLAKEDDGLTSKEYSQIQEIQKCVAYFSSHHEKLVDEKFVGIIELFRTERENEKRQAHYLTILGIMMKTDTTRWMITPQQIKKVVPDLQYFVDNVRRLDEMRYLAFHILIVLSGDRREDVNTEEIFDYLVKPITIEMDEYSSERSKLDLFKLELPEKLGLPSYFRSMTMAFLAKSIAMRWIVKSDGKAMNLQQGRLLRGICTYVQEELLKIDNFFFETEYDAAENAYWIFIALDYLSQTKPEITAGFNWDDATIPKVCMALAIPRYRRLASKTRNQMEKNQTITK